MANPKTTREGPKVFLSAGTWTFESNHKDSDTWLCSQGLSNNALVDWIITEDTIVWIEIRNPGTERSISISAIKCH